MPLINFKNADMNKLLLIFLILISGHKSSAQSIQDSTLILGNNNINVNLLGDASFISLKYERQFFLSTSSFISSSFGVGYNAEFQFCLNGPCNNTNSPKRFLTVPHSLTINFGRLRNFFEIGVGGTILFGDTSEKYFLYPIIAWRIQPNKSGKGNFRLFASVPFSGIETEDILWIPVGISFGKIF